MLALLILLLASPSSAQHFYLAPRAVPGAVELEPGSSLFVSFRAERGGGAWRWSGAPGCAYKAWIAEGRGGTVMADGRRGGGGCGVRATASRDAGRLAWRGREASDGECPLSPGELYTLTIEARGAARCRLELSAAGETASALYGQTEEQNGPSASDNWLARKLGGS